MDIDTLYRHMNNRFDQLENLIREQRN